MPLRGFDLLISFFQGPRHGLLTKHVFPSVQRIDDNRGVHVRRGTNTDYGDVVPAKQISIIRVSFLEAVLSFGCVGATLIKIRNRHQPGELRQAPIRYCLASYNPSCPDFTSPENRFSHSVPPIGLEA